MSTNLCDLMQFNSRSNATSTTVESRGFSGAPGCSESTLIELIAVFVRDVSTIDILHNYSIDDAVPRSSQIDFAGRLVSNYTNRI